MERVTIEACGCGELFRCVSDDAVFCSSANGSMCWFEEHVTEQEALCSPVVAAKYGCPCGSEETNTNGKEDWCCVCGESWPHVA